MMTKLSRLVMHSGIAAADRGRRDGRRLRLRDGRRHPRPRSARASRCIRIPCIAANASRSGATSGTSARCAVPAAETATRARTPTTTTASRRFGSRLAGPWSCSATASSQGTPRPIRLTCRTSTSCPARAGPDSTTAFPRSNSLASSARLAFERPGRVIVQAGSHREQFASLSVMREGASGVSRTVPNHPANRSMRALLSLEHSRVRAQLGR